MTVSPQLMQKMLYECLDPNESPFGLWINALFSVVTWLGADLTFTGQKEAFFILLERLLRERHVLLSPPPLLEQQEPFYWVIADGYSDNVPHRPAERVLDGGPCRFRVWDVPIERQMAYMREAFPKEATHAKAREINDFWYDGRCPMIGWIHPETGVLWGS